MPARHDIIREIILQIESDETEVKNDDGTTLSF